MNSKKFNTVNMYLKVFYKFVLPTIIIVYILFISSNLERAYFGNSVLLDFLARLWVTIMFCSGYIMLSNMRNLETWFYGDKWMEYLSENTYPRTINLVMTIIFSIFAAIITNWIINQFLPIYNNISILLATINGILFFIPRIYHIN